MEAMPITLNLRVRNVALLDAYADALGISRSHASRLLLDKLVDMQPSLIELVPYMQTGHARTPT